MIGETLGNYRIVSVIGEGGMGLVYAAEHTLIGRKVAIKLLRSDVAGEAVERFFTEARAAARLHHPGLVDVFDFGHHSNGRAFIVMEFLEGESLADRIARDTRLSLPFAVWVARAVAKALDIAHKEGIVHRDLKPHNIFLVNDADSPTGVRTKVLDFGIAKLSNDQAPRSVKTNSGAVMGTPRYMSPEQCRNARGVDRRADVYSLGCILYEMLVGSAPFEYDSWAELVGAHLHETPRRLSERSPQVPSDIERVVEKMLAKRADDRYPTMTALASELEVVYRAHASEDAPLTPPAGIPRVSAPSLGPTLALGSDPTLDAEPEPAREVAPAKPDASAATLTAPTNEREIPTAPVTKVGSRRTLWLALAGLAAAGGGVAIYAGVAGGNRNAAAPSAPAYVVVDKRDPGSASAPIPQPSPAPADAGVAAPVVADARIEVPAARPDPVQRAFERHNAEVTACFRDHPPTTDESISLRVHVEVDGRVAEAEVLPESVTRAPLGACLAAVARSISFGPQKQPVTFRVPIRATLHGAP